MKKNYVSLTLTLLFSLFLMNFVSGCSGKDSTTADKPATNSKESPNSVKTEKNTPVKPETTKSGNTEASNNSAGLTIEKTILGKKVKGSETITPVSSPVFKQGETIAFVLANVGKFKKGSDGKNKFDLDMEVKEGNGKLLGAKKGLLGEGGHIALPNDIAKTPYASLDTSVTKLKPGTYTMQLTIRDLIGGGSATESTNFTIQ
jgi:hypothetical protein